MSGRWLTNQEKESEVHVRHKHYHPLTRITTVSGI